MKKGETFQKEKKGKERRGNISEGEMERKGAETFWKEKWKGKEQKHFGRRNGKERSGNISEGEMERKGAETLQKEKWKGKERKGNILQRRRKERKIRKEEKACRGSCSDVAGYGELSFRYSRGPAYQGIIGGIACRVQVNG